MKKSVVLLSLLAVVGCAKEVPVTGEVFVVTRGRTNIKMALVTVRVFPEGQVKELIAAKIKAHEDRFEEFKPKVTAARDAMYKAKAAADAADAELYRLNRYDLSATARATLDRAVEADKARDAAQKELQEAVDDATLLSKGTEIMSGWPTTPFEVKTDGDGKFNLILKPGKYVMTADSSRFTGAKGQEIETYYWVVWVTVGNKPVHVMLSNDNQTEAICAPDACVFDKTSFKEPW